jgi:hypothetical protein
MYDHFSCVTTEVVANGYERACGGGVCTKVGRKQNRRENKKNMKSLVGG